MNYIARTTVISVVVNYIARTTVISLIGELHIAKLIFSYLSESSPALAVFYGDIGCLKKNPRSSIGLEIGPQSAFSAFRALLPSANYTAE